MTPITPLDPIGPLQLRVMNHLWKHGASTVLDVQTAMNSQSSKPLAYTTFLTVMRNLVRRGLLAQHKTASKRHEFVPVIDAVTYKSSVVQAVVRDYCDGDQATLLRYLAIDHGGTGSHAPQA